MISNNYNNKIYSGVLGKIIGVYLGRPVEGWSYDKICKLLGDVSYYVNSITGAPLIVPDDDISGTFTFIRALEDHGYNPDILSQQIGQTWLNYIVENKTILWWGGLSRSTEHTAFLRLKNGFEAPESGSIALNGESMATQIGAQIFIDSWALVNPGDPERTAYMAREAARVSHDGIAVEAAVYLAVMEAMAFDQPRLDILMDRGLDYVQGSELPKLVDQITAVCSKTDDWRVVRKYIADNHDYHVYLGNCPMVTNHLAVLMSLIMGGDDFQKSIYIAASAAWDTDCNAGNVGCLNGIRLGLKGIEAGADFRTPVADRMLVVNADGGSCISDAVQETKRLLYVNAKLYGKNLVIAPERFSFDYPGSTQGFYVHKKDQLGQTVTNVEHSGERTSKNGLLIPYNGLAFGTFGTVCVDTFTDLQPKGIEGTSFFEVLASPTLYETQTVKAVLEGPGQVNPDLRLFIEYYTSDNSLKTAYSGKKGLDKGMNTLEWKLPQTNGFPIYRIGIELTSDKRIDGFVRLQSLDWSNSPENLYMGKSYEMTPALTPWTTDTTWLKSFISSAENFYPDYTTTFSLSHPVHNGVVTIGTTDWMNYTVSSKLTLMQNEGAGVIARCRGHKRYYSAVIQDGFARIIKQRDRESIVLAELDGNFPIEKSYHSSLMVDNSKLAMVLDGKKILSAQDDEYPAGGAGFVVHTGAILVDGFSVTASGGEEA